MCVGKTYYVLVVLLRKNYADFACYSFLRGNPVLSDLVLRPDWFDASMQSIIPRFLVSLKIVKFCSLKGTTFRWKVSCNFINLLNMYFRHASKTKLGEMYISIFVINFTEVDVDWLLYSCSAFREGSAAYRSPGSVVCKRLHLITFTLDCKLKNLHFKFCYVLKGFKVTLSWEE